MSFNKALNKLIELQLDPAKKAKSEDLSQARKAVIAQMGVGTLQVVESAIVDSAKVWDPVLKRTKKSHGRKSEEYLQLLDAKKDCLKSYMALGKRASGR